ncbi:MAG: ABC transporter permease [Bacteroidota bacterium]|nr:ABC transporter permease [Bacteroidota bacterium]
MIKNYFKTAWRYIKKHKAYSLINILGLALGIASCLIIFLVVQYELGYDQFYKKSDRTYRVTLNQLDFNPSVSMGVVPALRTDFPELEDVSQVWYRKSALLEIHNEKYEEKGMMYADKYFPEIFDQHWLEGNPKTALTDPNSIVLTESIAHKYFGNKEAMGQFIKLENKYNLKITGVIKNVLGNTHLPFNMIVSFATVENDVKGMMSNFYAIADGSFAYIVTPKNYHISQMQSLMHGFIEKNWGKDIAKDAKLPLQPLTDIHFDQRYLNNTISYTTSRETYYALIAIAVLIIIIACINFINLATAQAIRRAKEVGVRKVLGSTRSQLIKQFLGETTFMVLIAMILGLLVTAFFLPLLSTWLSLKISIAQLLQSSVILVTVLVAISIIILAGLYPAFVQSAFRPIESLKSKPSLTFSGLTLRKSLVVIQFAICQVMIIGTLVVAYQIDFFENRDLGFDKEAVISFKIPDKSKTEVLRNELQNNPGVKQVSFSSGAPVISNNFTSFTSPESGIKKEDVTELKFIDEDYTKMFALKMLAGESVQRTETSDNDSVHNVVVNETMIHKLGIQDPQKAIGKYILLNGSWNATITGVVKDFQSESKHKKIRPCVLLYNKNAFFMVSARLQTSNMNQTIARIDKAWSSLFPQNVFSYEFLDDHIAAWYSQEQKEYTAFKLFALIAIIIGSMGLYGLITFAAAQRGKEVGIRKVLGASLADIVFLFSKEFVILIAIAFLIAAPLAYYIMYNWLQSFAYQINIGANIFVIAILSSFIIAAFTIGYQAIKAGIVNPINSLRSE